MKSILAFAVALIAMASASAGDCAGGGNSVLRVRSTCQQATAYEYEAPAVATVQTVVVPTVVSQVAYQPVVQVQRVVQVQQVQHVQQVVQVQKVQHVQNVQVRNVRARADVGTLEVRPTGLARLLGTGGPDIRANGAGGVDVRPTGIAGLLGLGGPRIRSR